MLEQLIREKAYQIWGQEGYPEGRAEAHWELAVQLVRSPALQPVEKPKKKSPGRQRAKKKV